MSKKYIGQRIKSARNNLGLGQEELAKKVNLPRPAISQIESGKRNLSALELVALSKALHQPLSFFVEPELSETSQEAPFQIIYRAEEVTENEKPIIDNFYAICKDYSFLEDVLEMKNQVQLPTWNDEVNTKWEAIKNGETIANSLRGSLQLGLGPLKDIDTTLENYGIKIIHRRLPNKKIWGFSVTSKNIGNCIFVNTTCLLTRQRFTIAHELGHLVMDHDHTATIYSEKHVIDKSEESLIEVRANAFAAVFLMPEAGIRDVLSKYGITDNTKKQLTPIIIDYLSQYYGVSYDSMLWRLLNLKYITSQQRIDFSDHPVLRTEKLIEAEAQLLPQKYKMLAFEAYRLMKISIGKLAELLRIDIYELRKIIKESRIQQVTI